MSRRIEITEEQLKLGKLGNFEAGDIKTFDDDVAEMIISNGWGKCVETGEQGERVPGSKKLEVHSIVQKVNGL